MEQPNIGASLNDLGTDGQIPDVRDLAFAPPC
jgi:hypothetical protein